MTRDEFYEVMSEHKTRANRLARETLKSAKEQKVDIPTLIASIVNEYACDCEAAVEHDMWEYR